MAGENLGNLVEHAVLLAVDLQLETVLARKGNLHPREKADSNSITTIRTTVVSIAFSF